MRSLALDLEDGFMLCGSNFAEQQELWALQIQFLVLKFDLYMRAVCFISSYCDIIFIPSLWSTL